MEFAFPSVARPVPADRHIAMSRPTPVRAAAGGPGGRSEPSRWTTDSFPCAAHHQEPARRIAAA
ncbi:hypothetical protein [Streptomyces sp. NPDC088254]|uniref:hypothetical protein n=1 Tax=Streptomyces sp. NPDC088254 TaxID=3365847 RepID=UPI00382EB101